MSECVEASEMTGVIVDPRPDDAALLLDALVAEAGEEEALEGWRMTDKRLMAELERAQRRATREQARWFALLAEAERREVTLRQVGLPTAGWLADRNSHWARSAREQVRLAVQLDSQPRVAGAMAKGDLSLEQAAVIVHGLDRLPSELDSGRREAVVIELVELGRQFGPYGLSRLVNRVVEVVAPQVAEDADRRAIERIQAEQERDRYLSWRKDADGAFVFRGSWARWPDSSSSGCFVRWPWVSARLPGPRARSCPGHARRPTHWCRWPAISGPASGCHGWVPIVRGSW